MSNGMRIVQPQILILLLSALSTVDAVGILRQAQRASALANFGSTAVNLTIGPHFASLHAKGDTARLQRLTAAAARIMTAILGAGFLLFALAGLTGGIGARSVVGRGGGAGGWVQVSEPWQKQLWPLPGADIRP